MHPQKSKYFDNILSKYQFRFRQGYNSQQHLLALIEKSLDRGCKCEALLTDLSEAFDCFHHEFLIAKFHAYSFVITTH